jgi:hypothetical protein
MSAPFLDITTTGIAALEGDQELQSRFEVFPLLQDHVPALVGCERVDPQTLQVIDRLFPAPSSGLAFLARLLRRATVKQQALSEEFTQDVAVITVQSIRELATHIGWGYDTTHKYVVLFCALGLLSKRRVCGKVELSFALVRYTLPLTLDALDRLIAQSRPKVQSFAKKVKRRYLLFYGNHLQAESPKPVEEKSPNLELDEAIERIRRLIEREPSPTKRQALITALLKQIEGLQRQGERVGNPQASLVRPLPAKGRLAAKKSPAEGTLDHVTRRRAAATSPMMDVSEAENGRLFGQTGDSLQSTDQQNGRLAATPSLMSSAPSAENGRRLPTREDSSSACTSGDGRCAVQKSPLEGASFRFPATDEGKTGDFLPIPDHLDAAMPHMMLPSMYDDGRLAPKTGDFWLTAAPPDGRLLAQTGDSVSVPFLPNGRLAADAPTSLTLAAQAGNDGRLFPQTGDFWPRNAEPSGRLLTQTGDSSPVPTPANGRLLAQTGDSSLVEGSNVNVNVLSIQETIDLLHVNVKSLIAFLLSAFREEPHKRGYYYNLQKQYARPECWLGAAIETLVGLHLTKTVKDPGRYFYQRCVALHREAKLPPDTQVLVQCYAHLTYPALLSLLTARATPADTGKTSAPPDQYAEFVTRRRAEQLAAFQAKYPEARAHAMTGEQNSDGGEDQYAAFVARRLEEMKTISVSAKTKTETTKGV